MASLIAKRLSKLPIGTHVELTYGDGSSHHDQVRGVITDSDFTTSVEITNENGEEVLLDFSIVRGVQPIKSLEAVLRELAEGTVVRFSHGPETNREPELTGTVTENDGEENIAIQVKGGQELILHYSLIRSLLPQKGKAPAPIPVQKNTPQPVPQPVPQPAPKPIPQPVPVKSTAVLLCKQDPEDCTNRNDNELKTLFDSLARDERVLLGSPYDSFKHGIRNNDKSKMLSAAKQAQQIFFREDDRGNYWSADAAKFCGGMLRRVTIYDPEVFLAGECFREAAFASWKKEAYALAGAYAVLSLLEEKPENPKDLAVILAHSMMNAEDCSGLFLLAEQMPQNFAPYLNQLISEACTVKGIPLAPGQDISSALKTLSAMLTGKEMAEEVQAWLPEKEASAEAAPSSAPAAPAKPAAPVQLCGTITRLNWSEHTGTITGDDGATYTFRYADIEDANLKKAIEDCLRSDLGGKVYTVKFTPTNKAARKIQSDAALVDRARTVAADTTNPDRFVTAFNLCLKAMDTPDVRRALVDLVKYSSNLYSNTQNADYVRQAMAQYEKNVTYYPTNAFAIMDIAQCYSYLKKYPQMLEHAEKAVAVPGLSPKQRIMLLSTYLKLVKGFHESSGDKNLLKRMMERIDEAEQILSGDFVDDPQILKLFTSHILFYRVESACGLNLLEAAEKDFARISGAHAYYPALKELMQKTRERLAPKEAPVAVVSEIIADSAAVDEDEESYNDAQEEEEIEEEILPYTDTDGWDALKTTKKDVVNYALGLSGENRTGVILAYLRAAASLNKQIAPVYHTVALAANDPMESTDYSFTALVNALAGSDSDYPELNDCCMGAAYLRSSFLASRGYDYTAQGLRDSISVCQNIPALANACDTLEAFRKETGRAIDIYADYRNHGVKKLAEDLAETTRHADGLYTKFVLTPAREGAKFARLLETRKILFHRDSYLGTMLHAIIAPDQNLLEARKQDFVDTYLGGNPQFSSKHISATAIDGLIADAWELANQNMMVKKSNAILQGTRRSNLRSNVNDILSTICQWYALSEQSAGLTWKTPQGEQAYQRLKPQLMEQLLELAECCESEETNASKAQRRTGLHLLATTARELIARLDGSWKFDQEKYLYADFLKTHYITLGEDFMPDLSSTFCILPEYNILARIRAHAESEKPSWQEQIDQIYGMDKACNNYGTAKRILEYLDFIGQPDAAALPENEERFVSHTQMQIDMRYRGFRETYALAMNFGQIIKSDAFCYTLEDTVRYWYAAAKATGNYGFFTGILQQAEDQIHASAQQYESQLDEQLDALIASNQQYFRQNPDYAEAIRVQIANQNFTVAEDWMARIRIGDFSLDVQRPEALGYLEAFWNSYVDTYTRSSDASRTLSALLRKKEGRNKDSKRAMQLIESWLSSGHRSNAPRIATLLNLLGWNNIRVAEHPVSGDPKAEVYEVRRDHSETGVTRPLHPIAAFGSALDGQPMYVICLYGIYDCDRLYEKMRSFDAIPGSKIILLDYALGQTDRRALARKMKKRESDLRNLNIVIDRVLITYLSDHYNENLINRILMAIAMPFAYYQPYVVESVHTMPPEIFIGRKLELSEIESASGVNLIYGGRQLGKSALFKKAVSDLDGHGGNRAVLIDIKELSCAAAARKISTKLIDLEITPDGEITEDWDILCRNIERRLRSKEAPVPYFLLMLDEADAFIDDCAKQGYRPLVALKDVQQSLPGHFKYVLAGLHNIVRFNRQVALGNNSVITHMPSLKITPFRTPEAQELLTGPLSYLGFSLPSKVTVSQILATCNYFPGLIQLYARKLIESIRTPDYAGYDMKKTPPYVVSDEHLRRVMSDKEFVEQIHEKFEITLTLDQDQGSCYYPLTLLIGWMYNVTPSKSGYTARDVLHHAKDLAVASLRDLDEEKIDALLLELQDLNILRSVSNNSYLLASKNFRDLLGSDEEIFEKLMKVGGVQA